MTMRETEVAPASSGAALASATFGANGCPPAGQPVGVTDGVLVATFPGAFGASEIPAHPVSTALPSCLVQVVGLVSTAVSPPRMWSDSDSNGSSGWFLKTVLI